MSKQNGSRGAAKRHRILIVEDEAVTAMSTAQILDALGYVVVGSVGTGEEAVARAVADAPDVVLMDVRLGGAMDGVDAAAQIRQRSDVPVIYVTGYTDRELLDRAKATRPYGYIVKPFDERDLVSNIEIAVHRAEVERELAEARRALKASERSLAEAQRIAHVGSWTWEIPADRFRWSREMYAIFGLSQTDIPKPSFSDFLARVHPDDRKRVRRTLFQALRGHGPLEMEYRIVRPDGEERILHSRGELTRDQHGKPLRMAGTGQDVTERRQAETKRRQALAAFENTAELIVVTDAGRHIVMVNRAFSEVTGYSEEEACGRDPAFLSSGRQDEEFYRDLWGKVASEGRWQGELWNRRKNGELYPEWATVSTVSDENGRISNYVMVSADISLIKQSQEELDHVAHHDPLTDLPNRLLFNSRLAHTLRRAQRQRKRAALLFLDLDRFKNVNDTLGHPVGDNLLLAVARRLSETVRAEDTVARLGGDEFVIILEELESADNAAEVAEKILKRLRDPIPLNAHEAVITGSIGISVFPEDGQDTNTLLRNADTAMYRAKDEGRNNYQFYSPEMTVVAMRRLTMEADLRRALDQDELTVYYQPEVDLATGRLTGVEALVRWQHPQQGLILPEHFIPLAEESDLIADIGRFVLRTACAQMRQWRDDGMPSFSVAVNLSGRQLMQEGLVTEVETTLAEFDLDPECLELEITESCLMANPARAVEVVRRLRDLGVTVAIDDFGTGYSSMSYLRRFAVNKLKTDRSFVLDIPHDPSNQAITRAIIALGHILQLKVIAEGVETADQRAFLITNHCDQMQGFLFSPPLPPEQLGPALGFVRTVQ